jgi:hypothetical protein
MIKIMDLRFSVIDPRIQKPVDDDEMGDEDFEDEPEEDFPEIRVDELLDDLENMQINDDEGDVVM